jgi:hypothetical protein
MHLNSFTYLAHIHLMTVLFPGKYEQPKQNVLQNHHGPICGNRLRKVIENIEIACVFDVRFLNVFAIK